MTAVFVAGPRNVMKGDQPPFMTSVARQTPAPANSIRSYLKSEEKRYCSSLGEKFRMGVMNVLPNVVTHFKYGIQQAPSNLEGVSTCPKPKLTMEHVIPLDTVAFVLVHP
jgi:hypothetical protein